MQYIGQQGLTNLKNYHYVGTDKSLIAKYIMQPFWNWVVQFLPLTVAANLVTVVGFAFIIWGYLFIALYAKTLLEPLPAWVLINSAICLFVYQTMDAVDGKQARRAQCSSPLGELTDHGCDALSTTMLALSVFAATQTTGWWAFYGAVMILLAFFAAQWQEYHTDTLDLGYVGVTEGQLLSTGLFIFTAFTGNAWWQQTLTIAGITLKYNHLFVILSSVPTGIAVIFNFMEMQRFLKVKNIPVGKAAKRFLPFILPTVAYLIWGLSTSIDAIHRYPHLFIGSYGLVIANMVSRMVLARVTAINFSANQPLLLPLGVLMGCIVGGVLPSIEWHFLVGYFLLALLSYLFFAYCVVQEMTQYLDIGFLTIKPKKN